MARCCAMAVEWPAQLRVFYDLTWSDFWHRLRCGRGRRHTCVACRGVCTGGGCCTVRHSSGSRSPLFHLPKTWKAVKLCHFQLCLRTGLESTSCVEPSIGFAGFTCNLKWAKDVRLTFCTNGEQTILFKRVTRGLTDSRQKA